MMRRLDECWRAGEEEQRGSTLSELRAKKADIRQEVLLRRKKLREEEVVRKSKDIEERLFSMNEFKNAESVMLYLSMKDEVRTERMAKRLIKSRKRLVIPSLRPDRDEITPSLLLDYEGEIERGTFGILEPKAKFIRPFAIEDIEFVIVPGIAFDSSGGRIGFGRGYYDRFMSKLCPGILKVGLAFELQLVEELPLTDTDVRVERIVTEKRIICC